MWDLTSGAVLSKFSSQSSGPALSVAARGDGSSVAVGGGQLAEWDAQSGSCVRQLSGGHSAPVSQLLWADTLLLSSAHDRFVCVWRPDGQRLVLAAPAQLSHVRAGRHGVLGVNDDGSKGEHMNCCFSQRKHV